jgi:hypothetical protein
MSLPRFMVSCRLFIVIEFYSLIDTAVICMLVGAGMTNTFFMHPNSAIVEIIPHPLCTCRSRDYFYGISGYYHGSSIAQGIRHYVYCVPAYNTVFQVPISDIKYFSGFVTNSYCCCVLCFLCVHSIYFIGKAR